MESGILRLGSRSNNNIDLEEGIKDVNIIGRQIGLGKRADFKNLKSISDELSGDLGNTTHLFSSCIISAEQPATVFMVIRFHSPVIRRFWYLCSVAKKL